MVERIKKIMDKEGCISSIFADTINVNKGTIAHILSGRNNPSLDVVQKILETYPNINSDWLLFGKLPMYKTENPVIELDLFDEKPINPVKSTPQPKESKEMEAKKVEESSKQLKSQPLIAELSISENIDKIVIFFKNKMYVTLKPEE